MAQTPGGTTPAQESICDPLKADGVTQALYGLCVAYCEAQDISSESVPLTEEEIQALFDARGPARRILEKYNQRKGPTDPEMPCVVPKESECPCYTPEEIMAIDGFNDTNSVPAGYTQCYITPWVSVLATEECGRYGECATADWRTHAQAYITADQHDNSYYACEFLRLDDAIGDYDLRLIPNLSEDQLHACVALAANAPVCNQ